jgi:hypothetical protein
VSLPITTANHFSHNFNHSPIHINHHGQPSSTKTPLHNLTTHRTTSSLLNSIPAIQKFISSPTQVHRPINQNRTHSQNHYRSHSPCFFSLHPADIITTTPPAPIHHCRCTTAKPRHHLSDPVLKQPPPTPLSAFKPPCPGRASKFRTINNTAIITDGDSSSP